MEYYANREVINRKRREKTAKAGEISALSYKSADTSTVLDGTFKSNKYDWALYKRRQRARAKEEMKKNEEKSEKENQSAIALKANRLLQCFLQERRRSVELIW